MDEIFSILYNRRFPLFQFMLLDVKNFTRHSVGVTAKPFAKGTSKMEDSVKFNYKIIFGRIRKGEGSIDD